MSKFKPPPFYEVIVGNIGYVYQGESSQKAEEVHDEYVKQSSEGYGRAAWEDVTTCEDGEPIREYFGVRREAAPAGLGNYSRVKGDDTWGMDTGDGVFQPVGDPHVISLLNFVEIIHKAGGVIVEDGEPVRCVEIPDLVALGWAYVGACNLLETSPKIFGDEDDD